MELPLRHFLETPTIVGLCALIVKLEADKTVMQTPAIVPLPRDLYRAKQLP
jgi:hypothetical protein